MSAGRTATAIVGTIIALVGAALVMGGIGSLALAGGRDNDGYLTTPDYELSSDGYAVTTPAGHIENAADGWVPWRGMFDTRVTARADDGDRVFVGIGPASDVAAYLDGVAHAEVSDLGLSGDDVDSEHTTGVAAPAKPEAQTFWIAQASGKGTQVVDWEPTDGRWSVVVMNADGSRGVEVEASGGVAAGVLWPVGLGLVLGGGVLLLIGVVLIVIGATRRSYAPRPAPPAPPVAAPTQ